MADNNKEIPKNGVLIKLIVNLISGSVGMDREDYGGYKLPKNTRAGTKLIYPKEYIYEFRKIYDRAVYALKQLSFRTEFGDFVPYSTAGKALAEIEVFVTEFYEHKKEFIQNQEQIISDFIKANPDLHLSADMYPSVEYLNKQIGFHIASIAYVLPESARMESLKEEALKEVIREDVARQERVAEMLGGIKDDFDSFASRCSMDIRQDALEKVRKMHEQLQSGSISLKSVNAFRKLVKRFQSLNWMDDKALSQCLNGIDKELLAFRSGFNCRDASEDMEKRLRSAFRDLEDTTTELADSLCKETEIEIITSDNTSSDDPDSLGVLEGLI